MQGRQHTSYQSPRGLVKKETPPPKKSSRKCFFLAFLACFAFLGRLGFLVCFLAYCTSGGHAPRGWLPFAAPLPVLGISVCPICLGEEKRAHAPGVAERAERASGRSETRQEKRGDRFMCPTNTPVRSQVSASRRRRRSHRRTTAHPKSGCIRHSYATGALMQRTAKCPLYRQVGHRRWARLCAFRLEAGRPARSRDSHAQLVWPSRAVVAACDSSS